MLVVVGPAVLLQVWSGTGRDKSASAAGKRFMPLLCGGRWPAKLRARAVPRPTRIVDPLETTREKLSPPDM